MWFAALQNHRPLQPAAPKPDEPKNKTSIPLRLAA